MGRLVQIVQNGTQTEEMRISSPDKFYSDSNGAVMEWLGSLNPSGEWRDLPDIRPGPKERNGAIAAKVGYMYDSFQCQVT